MATQIVNTSINSKNKLNLNTKNIKYFYMSRKKLIAKNWQLYLLTIPALVYFIVFCYGPIYGLQIAFKDFSPMLGIMESPWVGFKYFKEFFGSMFFTRILSNTVGLGLYLISTLWTPIVLALMINEIKSKAFSKIAQNISYAPYFVSTIVMVGLLNLFLAPDNGIVNKIIGVLGSPSIDFMTDANWYKTIFVISNVWQNVGWASIIYIAALTSVDQQLIESAIIDGTTRLQRIWYIMLPSILPTIVIIFLLNVSNITTTDFQKAFAMQNDLNMSSSDVIATFVYRKGLINANYSLATAVGLFNGLLTMAVLAFCNKIAKRLTGNGLW